jgi:hypothetical protein
MNNELWQSLIEALDKGGTPEQIRSLQAMALPEMIRRVQILIEQRDAYAAALTRIASEHRWAQQDYRDFACDVLQRMGP